MKKIKIGRKKSKSIKEGKEGRRKKERGNKNVLKK